MSDANAVILNLIYPVKSEISSLGVVVVKNKTTGKKTSWKMG